MISINDPIAAEVTSPKDIPRPSYFPRYDELEPEQRYIYLKFLENPLNGETDIGYVFLFYYGLERHLFEGLFEDAFELILKLRQVYDNSSFQNYSFVALAVTSLAHGRMDLFEKLVCDCELSDSLLNINFLLLTKIYNQKELIAEELMKYARRFEFVNTKYIKDYPDLFKSTLAGVLNKKGGIYPYKYLNKSQPQNYTINAFANMSIHAETNIPNYVEVFKFKMECYKVLEEAHSLVKEELKNNRDKYIKATPKVKPIYSEDSDYPNIDYYLKCENADSNFFESYSPVKEPVYCQHLRYQIAIEHIYRDRDYPKALSHVIDLCKKDINLVQKHNAFADTHYLDFESFKRIAIIYEKQKEYQACYNICKLGLDLMDKDPNNPFNEYYGSYLRDKILKIQTKL